MHDRASPNGRGDGDGPKALTGRRRPWSLLSEARPRQRHPESVAEFPAAAHPSGGTLHVALHQGWILQRRLRPTGRWSAWPLGRPIEGHGASSIAPASRSPEGAARSAPRGVRHRGVSGLGLRVPPLRGQGDVDDRRRDMADDIDYDNFKAAVGRHRPSADRASEAALHDVWQVMYDLQATGGR